MRGEWWVVGRARERKRERVRGGRGKEGDSGGSTGAERGLARPDERSRSQGRGGGGG